MSTGRSVCFGEASTRWAGDRCAVGNQSQVRGRKGCNQRGYLRVRVCARVWRGEKVGHSTVGQWDGWLWAELVRCHFPATFVGYIGHTCRIRTTTVKSSTPQCMDSAPTTSSASRTATSPPPLLISLQVFTRFC